MKCGKNKKLSVCKKGKKECYEIRKVGAKNPIGKKHSTKKEAGLAKARFMKAQRKMGARPRYEQWKINKIKC